MANITNRDCHPSVYKLLIVDDDHDDILIIKRHLDRIQHTSYQVQSAGTVERGLALILEDQFDACLLDYCIGCQTAAEFLAAARHFAVTCPIIILTGTGNESLDHELMALGASDFLEKKLLSPVFLERSIRYSVHTYQQIEEQQLINKQKSAYIANMSHELRTPLNAILGFTQRARQKLEPKLTLQEVEWLDIAIDNSQHLLALINQLVDLSRIEAGKLCLKAETVAIVDTLRAVVQHHHAQADQYNLSLNLNCPDEPIFITGDVTRIRQIFDNLVSNAIKYTEKGSITINATVKPVAQRKIVEVQVCDTGIGMTLEQVAQIFDRFNHIAPTINRKVDSMGLGLPITKELVDLHHGTLQVTSVFGQGSTFIVSLPCVNKFDTSSARNT